MLCKNEKIDNSPGWRDKYLSAMSATSHWLHALLLAACTLMISSLGANAQDGITGAYRLNVNHEPEGGTKLFLMPDSTYAIVYFGGARAGRWRVEADSLLFLTPTDVPANSFAVYGRRHDGLRGKTRIFYTGSFERAVYAGWGATRAGSLRTMRRVFNEDANCLSFPTVDTFDAVPDSIALVEEDRESAGRGDIHTFQNTAGFNDFVVVHSSRASEDDGPDAREPIGAIRAEGIYLFGTRHTARRGEMPTSEEDLAFFGMLNRVDPNPDTLFYNPHYRAVSELEEAPVNLDTYTSLPSRDMLVLPSYTEGAEYAPAFDFHDMRVLYRFLTLAPQVERSARFAIEKGSIFRFVCD